MKSAPGVKVHPTFSTRGLFRKAHDAIAGVPGDRRGETLFIDARKLGYLVDRIHRELTEEEIARIAATYHAWRGESGAGEYADVLGFCKSATLEHIKSHGYVLTPGRYVGAEEVEDKDEQFEEKMQQLTAKLEIFL